MTTQNLTPNYTFNTSSKRKEDVTVAELKSLPWFATHSDDELASIIEAVKIFSRAIVDIHARETTNKRTTMKSTVIDLNVNPLKKAA